MTVIAMTREMATLGKDVAAGLAAELDLRVVHHELVEHDIAERAGMAESDVHRFLEGQSSLLERWKIDRSKMARYTTEEILELAQKGNVLIRGWGATYLLREVPHAVCVRVCAPMSFRRSVLMKRIGIADPAAAEREIGQNDTRHNGTMQRMFGRNFSDATLYDIVLNSASIPVDDCVKQIAGLAKSSAFEVTPQSRGMLEDLLLKSRVQSALNERLRTRHDTLGGIDVAVVGGKVTLTGAVTEAETMTIAEHAVHSVEGVRALDNQVRLVRIQRYA